MIRERESKRMIAVLILVVISVLVVSMISAQPLGGTLTRGNSTRGSNPDPSTTEAQAGNVTALNIDQTRITDIWQGFFGNISGQIVLENSAGANFYDWQIAEITGEIYATRNIVPDWTQINCTNQTHWEEEENRLNIASDSTDGINETFNQNSHPGFWVGQRPMSGCPSTQPYNSSGLPGDYWNVLLNSNLTNTVYTAVLSDNSNAFDNSTVDFEVLVPVDRSTGLSTYYFYVELD